MNYKCVKFMLVCADNLQYMYNLNCSLINFLVITHKCGLTIPGKRYTQIKNELKHAIFCLVQVLVFCIINRRIKLLPYCA